MSQTMTASMKRALVYALHEDRPVHIVSRVGEADLELQGEGVFEKITVHTLINLGYFKPTIAFNRYKLTEEGVAFAKTCEKGMKK